MNIMLWIVAGGLLGWAGFAIVRANRARGLVVSIIIGIAGAFFGGDVLAPLLGAVEIQNVLNLFSLVVALATATAFLVISNLLSRRYQV
jgi:uncharacterized membrane protein YeaQ/YmgE (transglycosylase-associated protein family)